MKCDKKWMPLYAVTDRSWLRGSTLLRQAEAAIRGGATCIQLREKELEKEAFLQEAFEMKALCVKYGVPLFINDDVEIAMACGADGVHIGQHDECVLAVSLGIADRQDEIFAGACQRDIEQTQLLGDRLPADLLIDRRPRERFALAEGLRIAELKAQSDLRMILIHSRRIL